MQDESHNGDAWELDTVTDDDPSTTSSPVSKATLLTILHAPDPSRVGERAVLTRMSSGAALSRLEPKFSAREGRNESPLFDPRLSRKPMTFRAAPDSGVVLKRGDVTTKMVIDGERLQEQRTFSARELSRGVVMRWADKFVLLLHRATPSPLMQDGFGLVGQSPAMGRVRAEIHRVSDLEVPVLLLGETGSGKDLVARAIHEHGVRKNGPFIAVNVAAIPPTLAAAELFGAVRGAYTGATQTRAGFFREAEGGTLFLDEIGDVPADIQVQLLRALDNHEIRPVGSDQTIRVNVRIVAATDANLEDAIEEGTFRAPLLHRLNGYEVNIPPLRARREDVGILLQHFLVAELQSMNQTSKLNPDVEKPWLRASVIELLARYRWPGNVRELRNAARKIAIHSAASNVATLPPALEHSIREALSGGGDPSEVPTAKTPAVPEPAKQKYRDPATVEDDELIEALVANRWRLKPTATQLNVSRTSLYTLMDNCAQLRRATQIDETELKSFLESCEGDLDAMSEALRVSKPGLKRRMKELGLH